METTAKNIKQWTKSVYDKDVRIETTGFTHQTALGGVDD